MLTTEDIKNLAEYLKDVFKDVFVTKEEFKQLDGKISNLQTSVDAIALAQKNETEKNKDFEHRVKTVETWAESVAPKVGVKFDL